MAPCLQLVNRMWVELVGVGASLVMSLLQVHKYQMLSSASSLLSFLSLLSSVLSYFPFFLSLLLYSGFFILVGFFCWSIPAVVLFLVLSCCAIPVTAKQGACWTLTPASDLCSQGWFKSCFLLPLFNCICNFLNCLELASLPIATGNLSTPVIWRTN